MANTADIVVCAQIKTSFKLCSCRFSSRAFSVRYIVTCTKTLLTAKPKFHSGFCPKHSTVTTSFKCVMSGWKIYMDNGKLNGAVVRCKLNCGVPYLLLVIFVGHTQG